MLTSYGNKKKRVYLDFSLKSHEAHRVKLIGMNRSQVMAREGNEEGSVKTRIKNNYFGKLLISLKSYAKISIKGWVKNNYFEKIFKKN